MRRTNGNFGLGILSLIAGAIWMLSYVKLIPEWFPTWPLFLMVLGAVLMATGTH